MNVSPTENAFDRASARRPYTVGSGARSLGQRAEAVAGTDAFRVVNGGSKRLSGRRLATARDAFDGTPCLPYVAYDGDGYAYDDGFRAVQNELHAIQLHYAFGALMCVLSDRVPEPLVASDLGVWHDAPTRSRSAARRRPRLRLVSRRRGEADAVKPPRRVFAPDVFVALDTSPGERSSYRLDLGEPPPTLILEILSAGTARRDMGEKRDLYQALGVAEFWMFDLNRRYLPLGISGFALLEGRYVAIQAREGTVRYPSEVLPVDFFAEVDGLRVFDRAKERVVENWAAAINRADTQHERAEAERVRAERAEAEVARLKAELARRESGV